jgi:hypothetical protein
MWWTFDLCKRCFHIGVPSLVSKFTYPLLSPASRSPPVKDTSKDVYQLLQILGIIRY